LPYGTKRAALLGIALLTGLGAMVGFRALSASPATKPICPAAASAATCVVEFVIPSSFDALPTNFRRAVAGRFSEELMVFGDAPGYTFRVDSEGQLRVDGNLDRQEQVHVALYSVDPVKTGLGKGARLVALEASNDKATDEDIGPQTKGRKASCDPDKPFVVALFPEEPLRRCLRTMFLLENVGEFNARTQALFRSQKLTYSDGSMGPLTLDRPGLTDEDRAKVVQAVKVIDAKARALGGFR
jgi:hypothetical protein